MNEYQFKISLYELKNCVELMRDYRIVNSLTLVQMLIDELLIKFEKKLLDQRKQYQIKLKNYQVIALRQYLRHLIDVYKIDYLRVQHFYTSVDRKTIY